MKSLSRVPLLATPWTAAYQAPLSMGFSRQEYWSGLPFPPPGDLPNPGIKPIPPVSPALQADSLQRRHLGSPSTWLLLLSRFSRVQLYNPMDYSPPGASAHGILQTRILNWVAMPSSRGLSDPGIKPTFPVSPALQADSLPLSPLGSPFYFSTLLYIWKFS